MKVRDIDLVVAKCGHLEFYVAGKGFEDSFIKVKPVDAKISRIYSDPNFDCERCIGRRYGK